MFFNFDTNLLNDKRNSDKLFVIGVILLSVGTYCLIRNNGIVIFSWGIAISTLYCTWLCFKELNELKRYAEKSEIKKYRFLTFILLLFSILLIVFPIHFNMIFSIFIGIYVLYREIRIYFVNKKIYTHYFGFWNIVKILSGILLIFSPLFFVKFLVYILSFIVNIFGIYFIGTAIKIKNMG